MSINQHFRGVVWPKHAITKGNKKNYQYVVVGCLITDEPIQGLESSEIVLDGNAVMMAEILPMIQQKPAAMKIGDATDVLLNLKYIVSTPD